MNNYEFLCVCQSKKGRTGFCDILPEYQKELAETREELALYKKALDMACEELWDDFSDCDNCPVKNNGDKCSTNYCGVTSYDLANFYLQKAREEE